MISFFLLRTLLHQHGCYVAVFNVAVAFFGAFIRYMFRLHLFLPFWSLAVDHLSVQLNQLLDLTVYRSSAEVGSPSTSAL